MPLQLRLVNLWCRDRYPWSASACGRLPRTGFLEPLRARQCGRRQRPALSCSHQRKPGVTPTGNSLHTSPMPRVFGAVGGWPHGRSRAWGSCVFPSYGLARLGGARRSRFRRDVPQSHRSVARLRRCEPPPPQNVLSEGDRVVRAACPTVLSAGRATTACPMCGEAGVRAPAPGDPGRSATAGGVPPIEAGPRGVGGGSHRLAGPVASRSLLLTALPKPRATSCTTQ